MHLFFMGKQRDGTNQIIEITVEKLILSLNFGQFQHVAVNHDTCKTFNSILNLRAKINRFYEAQR